MEIHSKKCKKCGRELPIEEFYKAKSCKDGHMNVCKECFKQQQKQYKQEHKEAILEQKKKYRHEHKEEIAEYHKQHYQDNKEAILEQKKKYYQEHKEERSEYKKQYYQDNKETMLERQKQRNKTPMGRASCLVNTYRRSDKLYNRGECTLTAQWMVDNIFTQPCHWCKKTDWHKLGCDRIDNSLPHTPDNVIPCCEDCNVKRGTRTYEEFLLMI